VNRTLAPISGHPRRTSEVNQLPIGLDELVERPLDAHHQTHEDIRLHQRFVVPMVGQDLGEDGPDSCARR
jgi:hypothetical protein